MYCPQCGKQLAEGAASCPSCGPNVAQPPPVYPYPQPYGGAPYNPVLYQQKSGGLAAVLALIIPGAGHLYAGKIAHGILFMAAVFGSIILIPLLNFYLVLGTGSFFDILLFNLVLGIIIFVVWIFQIVDAYNWVKKYNAALMATGQAPW